MASPAPQKPAIPDPSSAALSVKAWALSEPVLASMISSGLSAAQAAARFGLHLLKENQSGDAATVFRAAIALSPDDADLWTNLGVALDRAGSMSEAAAALEQSIALASGQPDIWIFLGVVRSKLGDVQGSEDAYRTALTQEPRSAAAWQCLALLKEQQRDYAAAIDCLRKCIELGETSAAISANLGKLYYQLGHVKEAHEAYAAAALGEPSNPHYQRMLRKARFLRDAIEGTPVDEVLASYRSAAQPDAAGVEEDDLERLAWLEVAAGLLSGLGHKEAAIRLTKKRVELSPASASARYLLDALSGELLHRAPADYIVENFDAFAERYDAQLVGVLGYDVPEKLIAAVKIATPANHLYDTLDAGCGTGLCGPLLRPISRKLTGVDLSPKMLEQAGRRGLYDALVCDELTDFLKARAGEFDLIIAADVILYFGDLAALFAGAAAALRPGGLFALSTEVIADAQAEGYRVLDSGRFAHAPDYVRAVARASFEAEQFVETTLRLDAKGRVRGNLFLFRRRAV